MAHYLVHATPRKERLKELGTRLKRGEFMSMQPFGKALSHFLRDARLKPKAEFAANGITAIDYEDQASTFDWKERIEELCRRMRIWHGQPTS